MEGRNVPEDLIQEILSRVPAKSLARFRSTSKRWNALLNSGRFAKIHSANAPKESLTIILMDDNEVYLTKVNLHGIHNNVAPSVKFVSQFYVKDTLLYYSRAHISSIYHCDGLLLCTTKYNRLVVWNPCSGETKWIKLRNRYMKNSDYNYALGYANKISCKQYKILKVNCQRESNVKNEYEIYDFTSDSWRVLDATTDWCLHQCCRGVSVKGNAYFLASYRNQPYDKFLLSFDFSTERFQSLSIPEPFAYHLRALSLSVIRDEQIFLLVLNVTDTLDKFHVWVTTTCTGSVMSWSKFLNVQPQTIRQSLSMISDRISFLADEQNKVVVLCCSRYLHIMRENHIQHLGHQVGDSSHMSLCSVLVNYVPSLARIQ